jgi:hypothetical protein
VPAPSVLSTKIFRVSKNGFGKPFAAFRTQCIRGNVLGYFTRKAWVLEVNEEQFAALNAGEQLVRVTEVWNGIKDFNVSLSRQRREAFVTSDET